jgi:hypothetical protein
MKNKGKNKAWLFVGIPVVVILSFVASLFLFNKLDLVSEEYYICPSFEVGVDEPVNSMPGFVSQEVFNTQGAECPYDYPYYCGGDTCGKTKAWCDNWENGGGHCKQNDPDWCCYDSGYVVCGSTNTCGPSSDWCWNFLNPAISCNKDQSRCCNERAAVYDFSTNMCCPSAYPFQKNNLCYTTPQAGANNYYTEQSNCLGSEKECNGQILKQCAQAPTFIYKMTDKGFVKGECGVDCLNDAQCPIPVISNITFCSGRNIAQNTSSARCTSDHKCEDSYSTEKIDSCTITCMDRPDGAACSDQIVYKSLGVSFLVLILSVIFGIMIYRRK